MKYLHQRRFTYAALAEDDRMLSFRDHGVLQLLDLILPTGKQRIFVYRRAWRELSENI